jgi:hypothetical protein
MTKIKAFDIFWDTEGHDANMLKLPLEVAITISDDIEVDEEIVIEHIQETYGDWPISHLDYEVV